jgi:hypothetical protein
MQFVVFRIVFKWQPIIKRAIFIEATPELLYIYYMFRNLCLLAFLCVFSGQVATAQHPLFGTWEMVSIAGVNVDGKKFKLDSATVRETKIITPTHYILIAMDKADDSWKFNRCYFGSVKIDGGKYYEVPIMSSGTIYDNVKTDFDWKINGKEFIQSGFIKRPDGKTIVIDKFMFTRSNVKPISDPKFVGTWQAEHAGIKSFLVLTSTHWMFIEKQEQKFTKASGGVYGVKGGLAELVVLYGTEDQKNASAELKGQEISFNNLSYSKVN